MCVRVRIYFIFIFVCFFFFLSFFFSSSFFRIDLSSSNEIGKIRGEHVTDLIPRSWFLQLNTREEKIETDENLGGGEDRKKKKEKNKNKKIETETKKKNNKDRRVYDRLSYKSKVGLTYKVCTDSVMSEKKTARRMSSRG